jgi:AraC-like DNA-binding protein
MIPEFFHFRSPYRFLLPTGTPSWGGLRCPEGEVLVWRVATPLTGEAFEAARSRVPGVALVVILPAHDALPQTGDFLRIIELCRPHSVLPHHVQPHPMDLQTLLRRPPDDLSGDVMDYLAWRGIVLDQDTRHVVRRTIELSGEVRTVSALSRSLYLSRHALGRRFLERGIPVPSHWLHFGRILRACVQLQNLKSSLFDVACEMSYPDGFALSNQMSRLIGVRPSVAREYLGWEWILEAWLRREATSGGFTGEYRSLLTLAEPHLEPSGDRRKAPRALNLLRKSEAEASPARAQER